MQQRVSASFAIRASCSYSRSYRLKLDNSRLYTSHVEQLTTVNIPVVENHPLYIPLMLHIYSCSRVSYFSTYTIANAFKQLSSSSASSTAFTVEDITESDAELDPQNNSITQNEGKKDSQREPVDSQNTLHKKEELYEMVDEARALWKTKFYSDALRMICKVNTQYRYTFECYNLSWLGMSRYSK